MKDKWVFFRKENNVFYLLMRENRLVECHVEPAKSFAGSLYIARVEQIKPELGAAFVKIGDRSCFLPLAKDFFPVMLRQTRAGVLTQGDELLVRGEKEAAGKKEPVVSPGIELDGRYAVLSLPDKTVRFSGKIGGKEDRRRLGALAERILGGRFGVLFRTNAKTASEEAVSAELEKLAEQFDGLLSAARARTAGSCLRSGLPGYLKVVRDLALTGEGTEFVTDDEALFRELSEQLSLYPELAGAQCRKYEDPLLSLESCLRLPVLIPKALSPRVLLPSGAWIMIEPTEALVSVDINSGQASPGKRAREDFLLKINLEAAHALMEQLRLRGLSGMIIADFISMKDKASNNILLDCLRRLAAEDPVKTTVVDMTALGLVEITRKREREPLKKQLEKAGISYA